MNLLKSLQVVMSIQGRKLFNRTVHPREVDVHEITGLLLQQLAESRNLLEKERSLGILLREDRTKVIINLVFSHWTLETILPDTFSLFLFQ